MQIGVLGINHKLADLKLREKLAKVCQKFPDYFQFTLNTFHFVILSTCNRMEIYFGGEDLPALHSYLLTLLRQEIEEHFEQKLYSFFGVDCFLHLTKVAAGLDSAILGETEILGQVKIAYDKARTMQSLSRDLHFLFQKSLAIAKKVRTTLQLGNGVPNLERTILQIGKQFFSKQKKIDLLFVGASEINMKILKFLYSKNLFKIYLCNRSDFKAQKIAEEIGVNFVNWSQLTRWSTFDWIIFGTKSPNYLLDAGEFNEHLNLSNKLIMDLSVPRNVDPTIGNHATVQLLNIDEINKTLEIYHSGLIQTIAEADHTINRIVLQHLLNYKKHKVPYPRTLKFLA